MDSTAITTGQRIKAIMGDLSEILLNGMTGMHMQRLPFISPIHFFPDSDLNAQLMNTAGIFAVGFLMRPIGGWLFGSIADKIGRKKL